MLAAFFKQYLLTPICYVAVFLVTLFILNQFAYFNLSLSSNSNYNSFEVIGVGKVSTIPKTAGTSFSVTAKGATQEEAKNNANKIQNQALDALTTIGIKKENIKTTSFSVNPNYEQESGTQPLIYPPTRQVQNGYVANVSTTIKDSPIEQINRAIDQLSALGANVGGVDYRSSDQTVFVNEAQTKAIQNAREQALNLAKASGFKLGKIITIRNADDQGNFPQPYSADLMTKTSPNENTNLQPGSNEITARMGVTFLIK